MESAVENKNPLIVYHPYELSDYTKRIRICLVQNDGIIVGIKWLVFNRDTAILRYGRIAKNTIHILQRIIPGPNLIVGRMPSQMSEESVFNLVHKNPIEDILRESGFGGTVDNHNSLYFLALPFAFSTGYLYRPVLHESFQDQHPRGLSTGTLPTVLMPPLTNR